MCRRRNKKMYKFQEQIIFVLNFDLNPNENKLYLIYSYCKDNNNTHFKRTYIMKPLR